MKSMFKRAASMAASATVAVGLTTGGANAASFADGYQDGAQALVRIAGYLSDAAEASGRICEMATAELQRDGLTERNKVLLQGWKADNCTFKR